MDMCRKERKQKGLYKSSPIWKKVKCNHKHQINVNKGKHSNLMLCKRNAKTGTIQQKKLSDCSVHSGVTLYNLMQRPSLLWATSSMAPTKLL